MGQRFFFGILIAAILLCILFWAPAWMYFIVLLILYVLAQLEFRSFVNMAGYRYEFTAVMIAGIMYLGAVALDTPAGITWVAERFLDGGRWQAAGLPCAFGAVGAILIFVVCVLRRNVEKALESVAVSLLGFLYLGFLMSFLIRISYHWSFGKDIVDRTGVIALVLYLFVAKFSDLGGLIIGCAYGKHKLIPEISPKKSVEGLIGGYVFSLLISLIFWACFKFLCGGTMGRAVYSLSCAVLMPFAITTAAVFGDLVESMFKRSVKIKDSSSSIPGLGGVLDLLDSVLISAPVMYAFVVFFIK